ncbi:hypothetical protein IQ22_03318 [Pseudomonas duriflava]|uniref:Uncharacterized protein n=1 Tax=Pseudomonas duriflava TaxID=459528 RepID=A0A562Q765_9PSED|nr:hypothetical protein [Pseudomonas duriflava]TWI52548.1 hypothetical protein IQ22_03318 [Pseudomonas duriflava]
MLVVFIASNSMGFIESAVSLDFVGKLFSLGAHANLHQSYRRVLLLPDLFRVVGAAQHSEPPVAAQ